MLEASDDYRALGKSITDQDVGLRLDAYLGKYFLFRSRTKWAELIEKGDVLINGKSVWRPSLRLKLGDIVSYYNPIQHEPKVNKAIEILWEKSGIIAVYKPSGLPMHEAGAYRRNTFNEVLKEKVGRDWAAIHRLDRETSGIVLCANTLEARGGLSLGLRQREFKKIYLAIVFNSPTRQSWIVDQPMGEISETLFRTKYWVTPNGYPSETRFEVLAQTKKHALFKVEPKTGRTHQIRIHSAWSGHHLVGDKKYFPDEKIYLHYLENGFDDQVREACLFDRLCLHAHSLTFTHPLTGEDCHVESPMPDDMNQIWNNLERGKT